MRHVHGGNRRAAELLEHPLRDVQVVELERSLRVEANRGNAVEGRDV